MIQLYLSRPFNTLMNCICDIFRSRPIGVAMWFCTAHCTRLLADNCMSCWQLGLQEKLALSYLIRDNERMLARKILMPYHPRNQPLTVTLPHHQTLTIAGFHVIQLIVEELSASGHAFFSHSRAASPLVRTEKRVQ